MIKVGQKVTFNPFRGLSSISDLTAFDNTEGIVKYVNSSHHWFSVEYGDPRMLMSFKFHDIGKTIKITEG